jgi:hypothetical protein
MGNSWEMTYGACNIFHSILVSKHKFHSCIVRGQHTDDHKLIARTMVQSNQRGIDNVQIHKFHWFRNPNYTRLVNNLDRSSGDHIHKSQFLSHIDRGLNNQGDIGRLVGRLHYNLHLASQPCRNSGQKHNFHVQNNGGPNSQLFEK